VTRRIKNRFLNNSGAAYLYVMVLAAAVLLMSAAAGMASRQNLYDAQTQQFNTKAYYLAREASEIGVSALLTQKVSGEDELKSDFLTQLTPNLSGPVTLYDKDNHALGTAVIKLCKENDKADGSGDDWAVLYITIKLNDYRTPLFQTAGETPKDEFEYYFESKVLCENTDKKSFDVLNEDKAK
jgi:hypothetical protein